MDSAVQQVLSLLTVLKTEWDNTGLEPKQGQKISERLESLVPPIKGWSESHKEPRSHGDQRLVSYSECI